MPDDNSNNAQAAAGWANAGVAVVGAFAAHAAAKLQQKLYDAQAAQANVVNSANNIRVGAITAYQSYTKSVNNNKNLVYGGKAVEANVLNSLREEDALTRRGFESLIQDAEQRGVMAASAGYAGAAGSVVDQVNSSTALRTLRAQREAEVYQGQRAYDTSQRSYSIMQQVVGGLDTATVLPNFTYGSVQSQQAAMPTNPWAYALAATAVQYAKSQPPPSTDSTGSKEVFNSQGDYSVSLDYGLK